MQGKFNEEHIRTQAGYLDSSQTIPRFKKTRRGKVEEKNKKIKKLEKIKKPLMLQ